MAKKQIDPVDVHLAARINARRKELGVSMQALAPKIGVSWQQFQKYTTGENRVSASRLWAIAHALEVPIGYFYEGLPAPVAKMKRRRPVKDGAASAEPSLIQQGPRAAGRM